MRAALLAPALLIALAAQPAAGLFHEVSGEAEAPAALEAGGYDPLLRQELMFLGADGSMAHEAPEASDLAAPMALPGEDSVAVWAHDAMMPASFAGQALLTIPVTVQLPALTAPPRALWTIDLLKGGEAVASADVGPERLLPGAFRLEVALPAEGVAFAAGDSIGLSVALHMLSLDAAPTLTYALGPEGARLASPLRFASLDALGHEHAPGDRHFLASEYALRRGELGGGLWGLDLPIGPNAAALTYPANATRLLLQAHLVESAAAPQESAGLSLPGGPATVYRGEVLVREVPAPSAGFEVACTTCSGQQRLATAQVEAPVQDEPLAPTQSRPAAAAQDVYGEVTWLLVLFSPAGIMLGASVFYVVRHGGAWHTPEASAPARPRPAGQQRSPGQPRPQGQRLQAGTPARRL